MVFTTFFKSYVKSKNLRVIISLQSKQVKYIKTGRLKTTLSHIIEYI